MLKIQNKMESSDMKLPDEVHKLTKVLNNLNLTLLEQNKIDNTMI